MLFSEDEMNNAIFAAIMSEAVLAEDWLSEEDNEAWKDL